MTKAKWTGWGWTLASNGGVTLEKHETKNHQITYSIEETHPKHGYIVNKAQIKAKTDAEAVAIFNRYAPAITQ